MNTRKAVIEARGLAFSYGQAEVLQGISLQLGKGEILGVIGPNGSGKTTLQKVLSGLYPPRKGEVLLKGRPLASCRRRDVASIMACVSQEEGMDFPFTAREIVAMGRTPYLGRFGMEGDSDRLAIEEAMELTDIASLAGRLTCQLSAGERQRMMIARAVAQEPELLLLDEPTSHLDLNHRMEINRLVLRMREEKDLGSLYITHDLNTASECCDRLLLLKKGRVYAQGPPFQVLTAGNIEAVYGCPALVDENPASGKPRVTPLMSRPGKERAEANDRLSHDGIKWDERPVSKKRR